MTGKQLLELISREIAEDPTFLSCEVVVMLDGEGSAYDLEGEDGIVSNLLCDGPDRYVLEVKFG